MTDLFDRLYPNATPEDRARHHEIRADVRAHMKQRACPEGCGCTEFYDDRKPEEVTGGFGVAGCPCDRCNAVDESPDSEATHE